MPKGTRVEETLLKGFIRKDLRVVMGVGRGGCHQEGRRIILSRTRQSSLRFILQTYLMTQLNKIFSHFSKTLL